LKKLGIGVYDTKYFSLEVSKNTVRDNIRLLLLLGAAISYDGSTQAPYF
jgi:hypothetical protein